MIGGNELLVIGVGALDLSAYEDRLAEGDENLVFGESNRDGIAREGQTADFIEGLTGDDGGEVVDIGVGNGNLCNGKAVRVRCGERHDTIFDGEEDTGEDNARLIARDCLANAAHGIGKLRGRKHDGCRGIDLWEIGEVRRIERGEREGRVKAGDMCLLVLGADLDRCVGEALDDICKQLARDDATAGLLDVCAGSVFDRDFEIGRLEDEFALIGCLEQDAREDGKR